MIKSSSVLLGISLSVLSGCSQVPFDSSDQHITQPTASTTPPPPAIIQTAPLPEPPTDQLQPDVYTVVVNDVAVKELLFALARDANVEIDISEGVSGRVTLNAIDNTFEQILERIGRQVPIRYTLANNIIQVEPDTPFLKHYEVSYVNMERTSESAIAIATEVSTTGASSGNEAAVGNVSSTQITNTSRHQFWNTLVSNVSAILEQGSENNDVAEPSVTASADVDAGDVAADTDADSEASANSTSPNIMVSQESGVLSVYATQQQHFMIEEYLDLMLSGAQRQVFIEATIVEVELRDDFQAGVDWSRVVQQGEEGFSIIQDLTGSNLSEAPVTTLQYTGTSGKYDLTAAVSLLNQFGDAKVLSTPKILALNNQTALLKVVDNRVYFTVEVEEETTEFGIRRIFETTVHTLPVGLVMSVTPQTSGDGQVTLNVRPTISRIIRLVADPNPALGDTESLVPEVSVREIETILRVNDGDIAVIGGLMQDNREDNTDGIPAISKLPFIGGLFSFQNNTASKSELVIFLKPIVIEKPSLDGEFVNYRRFLEGFNDNQEPVL